MLIDKINVAKWCRVKSPSLAWCKERDLPLLNFSNLTCMDFTSFSYNRDRRCERVVEQCDKMRNRYVTEETYSSCSSPIFVVNKKAEEKRRSFEEFNLRRSPRKSISKFSSPGNKGKIIITFVFLLYMCPCTFCLIMAIGPNISKIVSLLFYLHSTCLRRKHLDETAISFVLWLQQIIMSEVFTGHALSPKREMNRCHTKNLNMFSAPESKAQVHYCDLSVCPSIYHPSSVRKQFTWSTSFPEVLDCFWWNLVGMKNSWSLTSVLFFS